MAHHYIFSGVYFSRYHKVVKRTAHAKEPLSADEEDCRDYNLTVARRGKETLEKGYRGQELTAEDIESLRLYAIWVDVPSRHMMRLPSAFTCEQRPTEMASMFTSASNRRH